MNKIITVTTVLYRILYLKYVISNSHTGKISCGRVNGIYTTFPCQIYIKKIANVDEEFATKLVTQEVAERMKILTLL